MSTMWLKQWQELNKCHQKWSSVVHFIWRGLFLTFPAQMVTFIGPFEKLYHQPVKRKPQRFGVLWPLILLISAKPFPPKLTLIYAVFVSNMQRSHHLKSSLFIHPETSGTRFWQENSPGFSNTGAQAKVINERTECGPMCRPHTFRTH